MLAATLVLIAHRDRGAENPDSGASIDLTARIVDGPRSGPRAHDHVTVVRGNVLELVARIHEGDAVRFIIPRRTGHEQRVHAELANGQRDDLTISGGRLPIALAHPRALKPDLDPRGTALRETSAGFVITLRLSRGAHRRLSFLVDVG